MSQTYGYLLQTARRAWTPSSAAAEGVVSTSPGPATVTRTVLTVTTRTSASAVSAAYFDPFGQLGHDALSMSMKPVAQLFFTPLRFHTRSRLWWGKKGNGVTKREIDQ